MNQTMLITAKQSQSNNAETAEKDVHKHVISRVSPALQNTDKHGEGVPLTQCLREKYNVADDNGHSVYA
jgi:hypothetical protein